MRPLSKKSVRKWTRRYVAALRRINASMWATDAMAGPAFRPSDVGDTEYVNACWSAFRDQQEEYHELDLHDYTETLARMPRWMDKKKVILKAFNHPVHGWIGHSRLP